MMDHLHPAVRRWFDETFSGPTSAQRRGWAAIHEGHATLIAAPTGSGKTLAAFLTALDQLVCEACRGPLPDEVRVVYVSPLKALSADIHKNLAEPRRGIRRVMSAMGLEPCRVTSAVRTGDTPQTERAAMLRTPPHILVTTPESLYLLLTAERSRDMLRTVRTVIVDEIHAVIGTRRGAHLALSLERLQQVATGQVQRIGLSATQKPIEEVARFLVGTANVDEAGHADCAHRRRGPSPRDGSRRRDSALAARGGPVERDLDGVLRPPDGAHRSAPHDAGLREHAPAGRAHRTRAERAARRRGGHGASREPLEGATARCRIPPQSRHAQGARGDRVAGAGDRHRVGRSGVSDRVAAPHRHAAAARRAVRPLDRGDAEGPALSRSRATT